jgi:hypothetical protein
VVHAEGFIARRKLTHRAWGEDRSRWNRHLKPFFGERKPTDVTTADMRAFVEAKLAELNPATIRVVVALLSSLYEDLKERGSSMRTRPEISRARS